MSVARLYVTGSQGIAYSTVWLMATESACGTLVSKLVRCDTSTDDHIAILLSIFHWPEGATNLHRLQLLSEDGTDESCIHTGILDTCTVADDHANGIRKVLECILITKPQTTDAFELISHRLVIMCNGLHANCDVAIYQLQHLGYQQLLCKFVACC